MSVHEIKLQPTNLSRLFGSSNLRLLSLVEKEQKEKMSDILLRLIYMAYKYDCSGLTLKLILAFNHEAFFFLQHIRDSTILTFLLSLAVSILMIK